MKIILATFLLFAFLPACFNRTQSLPVFATLPDPEVSLETIPKIVRGGFIYKVAFRASAPDGGEIKSVTVEISKNGGGYELVRSASAKVNSFDWQVAEEDVAVAKLRVVAKNNVGQLGISESNEFEIRSRGPRLLFDNEYQSGSYDTFTRVRRVTLTGTCESGLPVRLSQLEGASASFAPVVNCDNAFYSTEVSAGSDGVRKIRVEQVDPVGHYTQIDINWTADGEAPVISNFALGSEDGGATTSSNYIPITLAASDARTNVRRFCLKYNQSATPSLDDPCWVNTRDSSVHATETGLTFDVTNYFFTVGFAQGTYSVSAWVQDAARNISSPAVREILFLPPAPPTVTQVYAMSTNLDAAPATKADRTVDQSQKVFIKWKAVDTDLTGAPISLYWTSDDSNYNLIAADVSNGALSPDCTLTGGATGCYVWTSPRPTGSYFKIRVAAKDARNSISFGSSNPLNMGDFNFLAGNTDLGEGGDARAAVLSPVGSQPFVVHPSGKIFVSDTRGLLMVDPKDGVLKVIFTRSYPAVDGPAKTDSFSACPGCGTVRYVQALALDYQGNILVHDFENMRRITVNGESIRIDTLFGGIEGTYDSPIGNLFAMPNGDFYFQTDHFNDRPSRGAGLKHYIAAENRVEPIKIEGDFDLTYRPGVPVPINDCAYYRTGVVFDTVTSQIDRMFHLVRTTSGDVAADSPKKCATSLINPEAYGQYVSADPATGKPDGRSGPTPVYRVTGRTAGWREHAFILQQGMDGELYSRATANLGNRLLHKYNRTENRWDLIAGNGNAGLCPDGSLVIGDTDPKINNCRIQPDGMFVDSRGRVYFLDRNQIRVLLDPEDPAKPYLRRVLTLAGQPSGSADGVGKKAMDARFGQITRVDYYRKDGQDHFVVADNSAFRIREFTEGGDILTVAGTGNQLDAAVTNPSSAGQSDLTWGEDSPNPVVSVDRATGDLFALRLQKKVPYKAARSATGEVTWEAYGPSTLSTGAEKFNYGPHVLGFDPVTKAVLVSDHVYCTEIASGCSGRLLEVTKTGYAVVMQQAPNTPTTSAYCADGTPLSACSGAGYSLFLGSTAAQIYTDPADGKRYWLVKKMNFRSAVTAPDLRVVKVESRAGSASGPPTGILKDFAPLNGIPIGGFAYVPESSALYYCAADGRKLAKSVRTVDGAGREVWTETLLSLPNAKMICSGLGSFAYNDARHAIVFDYLLNGLTGVAEYQIPQ